MLYDLFKDRQRSLSYMSHLLEDKFEVFNNYRFYDDIISFTDFKKCKNIDSNRSKKRTRCFRKYFIIETISKLTNATMVFGTITFNDKFLQESYETQKKRVQRYLKNYFFYVVKNIDFGAKNERKHYHYIGLTFDKLFPNGKFSKKGRPMYNFKNDWWELHEYGFAPNMEIIPYHLVDKKRLSNYMVKLNNHSNKQSVKKSRLSILKNNNYLKKYCNYDISII